jgi:SAM-dependent methyltransferase
VGTEPDEGYFGERVAALYDERSSAVSEPAVVDPVVDVLAAFAGDGAALELGIGTGRIALPLAARGVRVAGIDNSEAMLSRLRAKPGAAGIEATLGDFATTRVDGEFTLVFLVFNNAPTPRASRSTSTTSSRSSSARSTSTPSTAGSRRSPSSSATPGPPSST